jgi:hypothetical protein
MNFFEKNCYLQALVLVLTHPYDSLMTSYAATLGHQPAISISELAAKIEGFASPVVVLQSAVIFESPAELSAKELSMLGGTVTLAKKLSASVAHTGEIPALLAKEMTGLKGKVTFSLRCTGMAPRDIHGLYRACKEQLKKAGIASRYVGTERIPAAAILLKDSHLLDGKGGCELMVIKQKESLWVGRTLAAQDIEAYVKRDMKKPVRDTTVGLLPPKLAQVLLNLGEWMVAQEAASKKDSPKKEVTTVLDPFCGTGVIPMECLLRGDDVIATDVSLKAVNGCTKNLEWTRKEYDIPKKDVKSKVEKHDATKAFEFAAKEMPSVIVTEGTLGRPLTDRPNQKEMASLKSEAEKLTIAFLKNVRESLPGVPVVMTWPVWYGKNAQLKLEKIRTELPKLGFTIVVPPGLRPVDTPDGTLVYRRADQFVGREIVLLRQK